MEVNFRCLGNSEKAHSSPFLFVTLMAEAVVVEKREEKKTLSLSRFRPITPCTPPRRGSTKPNGYESSERSLFCTYLEHRPVLEPYQSSCAHSFLIKVILRKSAKPFSISSLKRRRSSLWNQKGLQLINNWSVTRKLQQQLNHKAEVTLTKKCSLFI